METISNPEVSKRNKILKGYAAFNDGDWPTLKKLLCEGVVWHKMHGGGEIRGRDGEQGVLAYLQQLRGTTEADFLGMAIHDQTVITVDFSHVTPEKSSDIPVEGDHACADRIVFDDTGCIKEVWHCESGTHP
jgi:hypothetical protein